MRKHADEALISWILKLLIPGEKPEDQQIRWLELGDRNVAEILVPLYHVTADHRTQLSYRNPKFFGGLRLRILRLPRSGQLQDTNPRFSTI